VYVKDKIPMQFKTIVMSFKNIIRLSLLLQHIYIYINQNIYSLFNWNNVIGQYLILYDAMYNMHYAYTYYSCLILNLNKKNNF